MLSKEIKETKNSREELYKFGIIMAIAFALLGGLTLWRHGCYYWCLFILSAAFLFLGFFAPALLKPAYRCWMTISYIMGWFMSRAILVVLFYFVVTPLSLLIRTFGKNFLDIKFPSEHSNSYWIPKQIDQSQKIDYEKQF